MLQNGKDASVNLDLPMSASIPLPQRARRVIRAGDKLYPEDWAAFDVSGEDVVVAGRQTAMEWWTTSERMNLRKARNDRMAILAKTDRL
ncbi:hypothetical protein ONS95_005684 [Cadophora gregata]|uniref:uncharacterized protein n=1 Tax=Cadophora gregata TaxID=51156 RepID=UPI0026DCAA7C|nr:uncharacterized protein ONS95_005684 [Cadophora gregata]KAK0103673.1 hypothetical protein ONS95_005684 [Cadophora gregata]